MTRSLLIYFANSNNLLQLVHMLNPAFGEDKAITGGAVIVQAVVTAIIFSVVSRTLSKSQPMESIEELKVKSIVL